MRLGEIQRVTLADGTITGVSVMPDEATAQPVIVYLHGGGGTYTEGIRGRIPQLPFTAGLGIPGYSINRPDYLDSVSLGFADDSSDGFFAASAEAIDRAIEDIWARHSDDSPGIIIQGCSIGAAIGMTLAAQWTEKTREGASIWPLLGVISSDVGMSPRASIRDIFNRAPDGRLVHDALDTVASDLDFGPSWAKDDVEEGEPLTVPRAEILELVGGWLHANSDIMASISVPVLWRIAEFDPIWDTGSTAIAAVIDALSTSAPYVDAHVVTGAIHPVFESRRGHQYTLEAAGFVDLCRVHALDARVLDRSVRA